MSGNFEILIYRDEKYLDDLYKLHKYVRESMPLEQQGFLLPKSNEYFLNALKDPTKFVIAFSENEKLLGFTILILEDSLSEAINKKYITAPYINGNTGKVGVIQSLCVNPSESHKGISKALIEKVMSLKSNLGLKHLYAQASVDNSASVKLFLHHDFKVALEWVFDEQRKYLLHYS